MRKLSIIVTIVALMLNVMSASHTYACEQDNNYSTQIIKSVDDITHGKNSVEKGHCTQCSCSHHSSQNLVSKANSSEFVAVSTEAYSWDNAITYSQLNFPPSRPPKA